jgi:ABC-2 type transport system ATP-binding protein
VSEWIVEADALTRRFGSFIAVDAVDLRVPVGSIFGFLGPSGSGKTTTMRMLCGLLKPTSGRAVVGGFDIEKDPDTLRENLGYMSQKFSLYPDLTVRENLEFYGGVYGLDSVRLARRIDDVLQRLKLENRQRALTASLPQGWKQRIALGAALLHEPPVLFLDEPTSGVDPGSRRLFWEIIDELATGGISVFVSTHAMDEVERCDLVGVMYRSRLVAIDSPAGLRGAFVGNLFRVHAEPLLHALRVIRELPGVDNVAIFGTAIHVTGLEATEEEIRHWLTKAAVLVRSVEPIEPTLEDVFVQLILRGDRAAAAPARGERV